MNVPLEPELESRLADAARAQAIPVDELIRRARVDYLDRPDEHSASWVNAVQQQLANVWPSEDFSDWRPPDADAKAG